MPRNKVEPKQEAKLNDQTDTKLAVIEGKIDRGIANLIPVSRGGSVGFKSMGEVMEMAKLMCVAQQAIPKHLREQPGLCLGVIMQAVAWEMEPFAVANKSFVVNDRLAYESQLVHAVIEARAPLKGRLRCDYIGTNGERQCRVYGTFRGEEAPHDYTTPLLKDIPIKNSPLWKWDVDQQLFYFASRAWARKWCPDVLLGVYTPDEAQFAGEMARDVTDHERIHNPLGGDDETDGGLEGLKTINGETPEKPADAPKAPAATKPPSARKNAQAKPASPAQAIDDEDPPQEASMAVQGAPLPSHPDTVTPHPNPARWNGEQYLVHLRQWTKLAVLRAPADPEFRAETYIADRWKREMALRNNLGVAATEEQRVEAQKVRNEAVDAVKALRG